MKFLLLAPILLFSSIVGAETQQLPGSKKVVSNTQTLMDNVCASSANKQECLSNAARLASYSFLVGNLVGSCDINYTSTERVTSEECENARNLSNAFTSLTNHN
ncbi:hypothetical protein AAA295_22800 [Klebsiella variicola]|uniref:hypothetical protein n=1 Tax=Klebsiella variicola TaxID=244366 RepID=UPI00312FABA9|nr:hypothetical protein [Klebsiella variicola]